MYMGSVYPATRTLNFGLVIEWGWSFLVALIVSRKGNTLGMK